MGLASVLAYIADMGGEVVPEVVCEMGMSGLALGTASSDVDQQS